jgi:hypothetical protein
MLWPTGLLTDSLWGQWYPCSDRQTDWLSDSGTVVPMLWLWVETGWLTLWFCFYLDEFWFSDGSLSDKSKCADPGLMPLPDTAAGLDWSHLVDAARAFEGKDSPTPRVFLCAQGACSCTAGPVLQPRSPSVGWIILQMLNTLPISGDDRRGSI